MPIVVACNCGKRFKAGDQFAGKRTRCPGCGQTLPIPGGAPATATAAPKAAAAPVRRPVAAAAAAAARTAPVRTAPPPPPPPREEVDDFATLGEPEEVFQPAARSDSEPVVKTKAKSS